MAYSDKETKLNYENSLLFMSVLSEYEKEVGKSFLECSKKEKNK